MSTLTLKLIAERNNKPTFFELGGKPARSCPFCQNNGIYIEQIKVKNDWPMFWCTCGTCGSTGPERPSRIGAIRMWQERE